MTPDKVMDLMLQVPLAGVNIIVVVLFLRFLEKSDERQRAFMTESRKENNQHISNLTENVSELHKSTLEHHTLMMAAVQEMRLAMTRRKSELKTRPA